MRVVLGSAFFIAASAVTMSFGCSSSSSTNPGNPTDGGGTGSDTGVSHDGGTGGDGAAGIDISGSKAIKITVFKYATPAPAAAPDIRARIETLGGTGHIDVKTGPDGTATFNVDPAKGPFDVTVADSGFQAISVMGVTDSVPGNIVLYQLGTQTAFTDKPMTGTITGAGATHKLQIDGWDFATVVTAPAAANFTSKYNYSPAVHTKIPLAIVEFDPATNLATKGLITPSVDRSGQAMSTNIDMGSAAAQTPTVTTVNIVWPTAGLLTGTTLKAVDPKIVSDAHIGTGIVEKLTPDELGAAMFVGIANIDLPAAGKSAFHLQVFGGDMKPDIAGARLTTLATATTTPTPADVFALVQAHDLTDGATLTVGAINAFTTAGASFGDVTFAADTTGYDVTEVDIIDAKAGAVWVLYSMGPTLASRGLPHLPAGVAVADLAGDITPLVALQAVKYTQGSKPPWQSILPDIVVAAGSAGGHGVTVDGR